MSYEEVLKAVFPLLDGVDLASCTAVCRQWRHIARDDYYWKCLCAKKWPSVCKQPRPPTVTYYKLYQTFFRRQQQRILPPPRLSFDCLDFFIDIWADDRSIFSEVVPGTALQDRIKIPSSGVSNVLRFHLESPDYKMIVPVQPWFTVPLDQTVTVSVLVGHKESNKVARIIDRSRFDYIDRSSYKALAFDYLDFSPLHPFITGIRAWISLLFVEDENQNDWVIDVFGIQLDFCDVANTKEEVLWLLDMLDWK